MTNTKHYFNFENLIIKGNIGSDVLLKTKTKERIEFSVAVNKFNKVSGKTITKWFSVIVFDDKVISAIKNNSDYKKGANVEIHGEVVADVYRDKPILKLIARQIALNIQVIETNA
jgi:single-stranded DNA-binding protein